MEEARLETVELCHPEKRNRSGKVFGGHIMRKAIELAWTSAYVLSKQVRYQPFEKGQTIEVRGDFLQGGKKGSKR